MTYTKHFFSTLFIGLLLTACSETEKPKRTEVSKTLQGISISSHRSSNAVDDLYIPLLDQNPALKNLEEELVNLKTKTNLVTKSFYNFDNKSNTYYNEAIYQTTTIKDSALFKKLLVAIDSSKNQYAKKSGELQSVIKQIEVNGATIKDRHIALKILMTLPVIENFQIQQLPKNNGMKELMSIQENLLQQIDSLSSTH
jgi:hypothetical protein